MTSFSYGLIPAIFVIIAMILILSAFYWRNRPKTKVDFAALSHGSLQSASNLFAQALAASMINDNGSDQIKVQIMKSSKDLEKLEAGICVLLCLARYPRFEEANELLANAISYIVSDQTRLAEKLTCLDKVHIARELIDKSQAGKAAILKVMAMDILVECKMLNIQILPLDAFSNLASSGNAAQNAI